MPPTRFSIVITCYNQANFIGAAVDSALALRFPSREIIVVDDGSTDASPEVLEAYGDSIRFLRMPQNAGPLAARNLGAAAAQGDYLVFFDGDDVFMPWALNVYESILAARSPKILCGRTSRFSGEVPTVRDEESPHRIEFVTYADFLSKDRPIDFCTSTLIVERAEFGRVGGWTLGIFQLDLQDIALKLGCSGPLALIAEPCTVFYRLHESNSINNVPPFVKMAHRLMARARTSEYPGGPQLRFRRYAWCGGFVFFWVQRARRAGFYKDALVLAVAGSGMIVAAILQRLIQRVAGRRPVETLEMGS
jgi:glycosyltransferase involved in cell wall biosynthesis